MLGYFSIIGLLRVHCLLGDYVLALRTLDNVELNKKVGWNGVCMCYLPGAEEFRRDCLLV